MSQIWKVVGGSDKGGIIVRSGKQLSTEQLAARLSTGALVEEVELVGDRLHYKRLSGTGPEDGWVSLTFKEKPLVVKTDEKPALPVVLMFPGQGSQYVKMLEKVKDIPAVQDILQKSQTILGWDLLELCLQGPEAKLEETQYCQAVMFVAGLAGYEKLRLEKPQAVDSPMAVCGLSLGEYTALCVAGVIDFEDCLRLVKIRGEAMQEAAAMSKQLMLSVAGLELEHLTSLCEEAKKSDPGCHCQIANSLFPKGYACGGSEVAIMALMELTKEAKALQSKVLKTSGAFHTPYMRPAQEKLAVALDEVLPRMKPPRCPVYMNVTGAPVAEGTDPSIIVQNLKLQLTENVKWETIMRRVIQAGGKEFYEIGPMKQLKAMMKRIDADVWKTTSNIEV